MATPRYDALVAKTRSWSNKPEANTISDSIIQDCLRYSADECYRVLRIPPLETTVVYTITAVNNIGEASVGTSFGNAYTSLEIPVDLTQFVYIRTVAKEGAQSTNSSVPSNISRVFNEIIDARTFFDAYSEKNSAYNWMWMDNKILIHPQLAVDAELEIHYYRRLPSLDSTYNVVPTNWVLGLSDELQPYLEVGTSEDTPLFFAGTGLTEKAFVTSEEAALYGTSIGLPTVTTKFWTGREVSNWLRDSNERLLLWGSLQYLGGFLFDDKMSVKYAGLFENNLASLNTEEKRRRTLGGNVRMSFNGGGLI